MAADSAAVLLEEAEAAEGSAAVPSEGAEAAEGSAAAPSEGAEAAADSAAAPSEEAAAAAAAGKPCGKQRHNLRLEGNLRPVGGCGQQCLVFPFF